MTYDTDWVRSHFERVGDDEWRRMTGSPSARVKLAVQCPHLSKCVGRGDRVLGVGVEARREPSCVDMGTHLITVCRRP